MTDQEIRIAIAEVRGWIFEKKKRDGMMSQIPAWHITPPGGRMRCAKAVEFHTSYGPDTRYEPFEGNLADYLNECEVPDYPYDLNAMHEAEVWLKNDDAHAFACYASDLVDEHGSEAIHLSAAQRAEAFLKTLNLWKP